VKLRRELIFVDTNVVVWLLKGRESVVDFFTENMGHLAFLPIDDVAMKRVGELVARYNLMPNDAMIAATCEHHGSGR